MRRLYALGAAAAFTLGAAAQQDVTVDLQMKQQLERMAAGAKMIAIRGGVMGPAVKDSPFSGQEIDEVTQVLADGTRIHRENRDTVYRDSEGRMRRETGDTVTVWDPVAGVSFLLDPKAQTATKMPLAGNVVAFGNGGRTIYYFSNGPRAPITRGIPIAGLQVRDTPEGVKATAAVKTLARRESLGRQMIEGLSCDGTRETVTIEAGAIGNDRPIQIVDERWYSPELQRAVMTRHSDPRTGEETFRLVDVRRGDPSADLFQVPANYRTVTGGPLLR